MNQAASEPTGQPSSELSRWDTRFGASDDYIFGTEPNRFLVENAKVLKAGGSVLSLADGEGRNGVWLAQQGFDVCAVEGSVVALEKARKLAAKKGVSPRFIHADLSRWDFGQHMFDGVVAIFIQFCGPELRRQLFERTIAALKPGGYLLLQGYRPEQLEYKTGEPSAIENLYTEEQLRRELAELEFISLHSYDAELSEGVGHKGMSALIDLVARKPK